jgi:hypothetical protein
MPIRDPATSESKHSSTNKVKEKKQYYRRKMRNLLELKLHSSEVQSWRGADTLAPLQTLTLPLSLFSKICGQRYASPWPCFNSSCLQKGRCLLFIGQGSEEITTVEGRGGWRQSGASRPSDSPTFDHTARILSCTSVGVTTKLIWYD